jgi:hypothetical protein
MKPKKTDISAVAISVCLFAMAWRYYSLAVTRHVPRAFNEHISWAIMIAKGEYMAPHPGFSFAVIALHQLSGLSWERSAIILTCSHIVLTFWVLRFLLVRFMPAFSSPFLLELLALGLMVAAPIGLPYIDERTYSFAFPNRSTLLWRNATHTALQPYALLAFGLLWQLIEQLRRNVPISRYLPIAACLCLAVSSLMKPSLALTLIPTILLCVPVLLPREFTKWGVCALVLFPDVIVLLSQFYIGFINPLNSQHTDSVIIAPFAVWSSNNATPWLALLLSIVFPLYAFAIRRGRLQWPFFLAAINFLIALIPYSLLKEGVRGERNFEWSYWIGLQILFLVTLIELFVWREEASSGNAQQPSMPASWRIAFALFGAHVAFGLARFVRSMVYIR